MLRIGDRVEMVDRYRGGGEFEPSWFHGKRGKITQLAPFILVHLDGELFPMAFDERDLRVVEVA